MAYGKVIELFLVNGTADSIVEAELSNWNGKAVKIPRIEINACDDEDITQLPGLVPGSSFVCDYLYILCVSKTSVYGTFLHL